MAMVLGLLGAAASGCTLNRKEPSVWRAGGTNWRAGDTGMSEFWRGGSPTGDRDTVRITGPDLP